MFWCKSVLQTEESFISETVNYLQMLFFAMQLWLWKRWASIVFQTYHVLIKLCVTLINIYNSGIPGRISYKILVILKYFLATIMNSLTLSSSGLKDAKYFNDEVPFHASRATLNPAHYNPKSSTSPMYSYLNSSLLCSSTWYYIHTLEQHLVLVNFSSYRCN